MAFTSFPLLTVSPLPEVSNNSVDQLVASTLLSTPRSYSQAHDGPFHTEQLFVETLDETEVSLVKRFTQRESESVSASLPQVRKRTSLAPLLSSPSDIRDSTSASAQRTSRSRTPSSSSTSADSSLWEEQLSEKENDGHRVRSRGHPAQARISDYCYLDARNDPAGALLSEAIHETLLLGVATDLDGRHLAPVHPASEIIRSLLGTASTGTASDHFQWDQHSCSFVWTRSTQHRADIKSSKAALRAYQKRWPHSHDELKNALPPPPVVLQSWIGSEHILGWTSESSDAIIRPFLDLGALLRRLDERLLSIRQNTNPGCKEAPAFAFALNNVLTWLKGELQAWSHTQLSMLERSTSTSAALLNAQAGLQEPQTILRALGNLLSCGQPRKPPFRILVWLDSTHACLSHLHAHLAASLASAASALSSTVLAYLLDQTSASWRSQIAKWIGFPGFQSNRTGELDDDILAFSTIQKSHDQAGKVAVPWSGAEIDWSFDERGEEDVGYTLRPSAVPSFLSFRSARDFLEAGRALRLLKKAAPPDHPLVRQWSLSADTSNENQDLYLPTWDWSSEDLELKHVYIEDQVVNFKRSISAWRRERHRRTRAETISTASYHASPQLFPVRFPNQTSSPETELSPLPSHLSLSAGHMVPEEDRFEVMAQLFSSEPKGSDKQYPFENAIVPLNMADVASNGTRPARREAPADETFLVYMAKATFAHRESLPTIQQCSFDFITQRSLVSPFQTWSRLINASLISVFFQDLGLRTYLETCKQFLLLGSQHFERQVISSLFEIDKRSALDQESFAKGAQGARTIVAMNRRLTSDGVWPPNDSLLSSALNSAVLETVSGMRQSHENRSPMHTRHSTEGEDAISLAYRDLDERLSFAIIEPPSTSTLAGKPSWSNPASIDALDWLTLSFHPPPLISPLLSQLAQSRYQRLWNLLLRIKRCKVAMRSAFQDTFKSPRAAFTLDFALQSLLQRLRWETNHFLHTYGGFVQEIGIDLHWTRFMERLDTLKREVTDELSSGCKGSTGPALAGGIRDEEGDDLDDEVLGEEEKEALMTSNLELKDVFSLARYHERVLDRMLEATFLKSKQRGIAKILNSVLQAILDFSKLCADYYRPGPGVKPPTYMDFAKLHRHFRSRIDTLVRALIILKDRRPSANQKTVGDEGPIDSNLPKRRKDIEAERHLLAGDELEDLRRLDHDARGNGVDVEDASSVEILLTRLDISSYYAKLH